MSRVSSYYVYNLCVNVSVTEDVLVCLRFTNKVINNTPRLLFQLAFNYTFQSVNIVTKLQLLISIFS